MGGRHSHPPYNWCAHHLRGQQRQCGWEWPHHEAATSRNRASSQYYQARAAENESAMNVLRQKETRRLLDKEKANNVMAAEYTNLLYKKLEALKEEEEARRRLNANSRWTFDIDQAVESSVARGKMEDVFINLILDQHGLEAFYLRQPNEPLASSEEKMRLIRQNVYFDTGKLLEPYISKQKLFVGNYPTGMAAIGQHPWINQQWKYFTHDQTLFKVKRLT